MTMVTITPGNGLPVKVDGGIGDASAGDIDNCAQPILDANIQISPTNASNAVGTAHVLTGHVNVNDGTGFVNAPAGTVITFSVSAARAVWALPPAARCWPPGAAPTP